MNYDLRLQDKTCKDIRSYLAEQYDTEEKNISDGFVLQTYDLIQQEQKSNLTDNIIKLIEKSINKYGECVAIRWKQEKLTYKELYNRIEIFKKVLQENCITEELHIGVCLNNLIDRIIVFLAIIKTKNIPIMYDSNYINMHGNVKADYLISDIALMKKYEVISAIDNNKEEILYKIPYSSNKENNNVLFYYYNNEFTQEWSLDKVFDLLYVYQLSFRLKNNNSVALWESDNNGLFLCHVIWAFINGTSIELPNNSSTMKELLESVSTISSDTAIFSSRTIISMQKSGIKIPHNIKRVLFGSEPLYKRIVKGIISKPDVDVYFCFVPNGQELSFIPVKADMEVDEERFSLGFPRINKVRLLDRYGDEVEEDVVGEINYINDGEYFPYGFKAILSEEGVWNWVENQDTENIIIENSIYNINNIYKYFSKHDGISDIYVTSRKTKIGYYEPIVAIVLSNEDNDIVDLFNKFYEENNNIKLELKIILTHSIPYDKDGFVNEQQLLKLPTIDIYDIYSIEGKMRNINDVEEATIIVENVSDELKHIHLSTIMPDAIYACNGISRKNNLSNDENAKVEKEESGIERKLAYVNGGDIQIPENLPKNLASAFRRTVKEHGDNDICFIDKDGNEQLVNYKKLYQRAKDILGGLQSAGIKHGMRVILQLDDLYTHYATFWACILGGIIPATVAIAPTYDQENGVTGKLYHTWKLIKKPRILTSTKLIDKIVKLKSIYDMLDMEALDVEELQKKEIETEFPEIKSNDVAFYQLTSGSTGPPKCIQEVHQKIIQHVIAASQYNSYCSEDIDLNWLQVDHVVPILTCHIKDVFIGNSQIQVAADYILENPLRWLDLIEKHNVTHTWSPNFGLKLISDALKDNIDKKWDLGSLKFFMNAGEQVTYNINKEFIKLTQEYGLKQTVIQPAFGMAEVCTCMTYRNDFNVETNTVHVKKSSMRDSIKVVEKDEGNTASFVSCGPPVKGVEIRITNRENQVQQEGVIGRFQIRGNVVMPGYLYNNEANRESFVSDGWFNTGDIGFILDNELYLTSREKEMIIIYGANYYCHEVEDIATLVEGVIPTFVAACGIGDEDKGSESLAIFFVPETDSIEQQSKIALEVKKRVASSLGITPTYVIPLNKKQFMKTTVGKIQRNSMKSALLDGEYEEILKTIDLIQKNDRTLPNWFYREAWINKNIRAKDDLLTEKVIICGSQTNIVKNITATIKKHRSNVIEVIYGDKFDKISDNKYIVKPNNIWELFDNLKINNCNIICTYSRKENKLMLDDLVTLNKLAINNKVSMNKVILTTDNSISVNNEEESDYNIAKNIAVIKTLNQEQTKTRYRLVDFQSNVSDIGEQIYLELTEISGKDTVVVYRNNKRMVSKLKNISLRNNDRLKDMYHSCFLVTGGSGGIGHYITKKLLEQFQAKVLLIARSHISNCSKEVQSLCHNNRNVMFVQADVCDYSSMEQAVDKFTDYYNEEISGVFHCAGVMTEKLLSNETVEEINTSTEAKIIGTNNIIKLLENNKHTFVTLFSSVNSYFGGFRAGAYSYGNAYLNALAGSIKSTSLRLYSVAWSQWSEIGMNKGSNYEETSNIKGFMSILPKQGWYSLLAILSQEPGTYIAGLDKTKKYVSSYILRESKDRVAFTCYYYGDATVKDITNGISRYDITDTSVNMNKCLFRKIKSMPLKEDGQVDRNTLRHIVKNNISMEAKFDKPKTDSEKAIAIIWSKLLKANLVSIDDNFFESGGNSLLATQLISRIRADFKVQIPIDELFKNPTIKLLAKRMDEKLAENSSISNSNNIVKYNNVDKIPLSFAQERLWFLYQMNPNSTFYNIQQVIKTKGKLEQRKLHNSLQKIFDRQATLRTTFSIIDGKPYQIIHNVDDDNIFDLQVVDLSNKTIENANKETLNLIDEETHKGFDLEKGPVARFKLVKLSDSEHYIIFTLHHIISDAWSMNIFVKDFLDIYDKNTIKPLEIEYKDYSIWQRNYMQGKVLEDNLKYWINQLKGYNGILDIKGDMKRPAMISYKGNKCNIKINNDKTAKINELSKKNGVTSYMLLLSIFQVLIKKYSKQDDIVVGCPIANRNHIQIENIFGFFVNTLAIRVNLSNDPTFEELLMRVKQVMLDAYKYQDMPFEELVSKLNLERSTNRQPLCQVVFVMENVPQVKIKLNGLELELLESKNDISKFDMTFCLIEEDNELNGFIEYCTDLYSDLFIEEFIKDWYELLNNVIDNTDMRLSELLYKEENIKKQRKEWHEAVELHDISIEHYINDLKTKNVSIRDINPLSPIQRDLYLDYISSIGEGQYGIVYSINLGKNINTNMWKKAVIKAHDTIHILKSRFFSVNNEFYQCIDDDMKCEYKEIEGNNLESVLDEYRSFNFHLFEHAVRNVLFRDEETKEYTAIIGCHHILLDAFSANLVFKHIIKYYDDVNYLIKKDGLINNFKYIINTRNSTFDSANAIEYWKQNAKKVYPLEVIKHSSTSDICIKYLELDNSYKEDILDYCEDNDISLPNYMKTLINVLLQKYYRPENDFVVYDIVGGRERLERDVVGCVYNVLPIINKVEEFDGKFSELVDSLSIQSDFNQMNNISVLQQRQILGRDGIRFYTNYYNFPILKIENTRASLKINEAIENGEVHFIVQEDKDKMIIKMKYNNNYNSNRFLERLKHLSDQIIANNESIKNMDITLQDELHTIKNIYNPKKIIEKVDNSIVDLFVKQAEARPNSIAVKYQNEQITYGDLNKKANILANHLISKGLKQESFVGIYISPSIDMVISILGTLKAGGVYVPIDIHYPEDRVKFIIDDSKMELIITESELIHEFINYKQFKHVVVYDKLKEQKETFTEENVKLIIDPNQLAYVIYTSGSTGIPKGMLLTHSNVVRLFSETKGLYEFNSEDVWTLFHSIAFDFSVWELWGALLYGGKLVVVDPLIARSPVDFYELLIKENVTVLNQTPSAFSQLVKVDADTNNYVNLRLRYIIFGGEALNFTNLKPWIKQHGLSMPKLINMYGITETCVHVTYKEITKADLENSTISNIGVPIPDLQVYIIDNEKILPVGAIGEIYIGGRGIGKGYLNRSKLTSQVFVENFIDKQRSKILYKSGDIGRCLPNGEIEYLGRKDHQVKIRGFRIELGEIESKLSKVEYIINNVVINRKNKNNNDEIVAYIVANCKINSSEIRNKLSKSLPDYMIPSAFVQIDEIPLNPNKKVDRNALPDPNKQSRRASVKYVKPHTELQELMVKGWEEVLDLSMIGIDDNFYELGGHSLLLVELKTKLNEILKDKQINISVIELFEYPTIRLLSNNLEDNMQLQTISEGSNRAKLRRNMIKRRRD